MESKTNPTFWNVDAVDFVPTEFLTTPSKPQTATKTQNSASKASKKQSSKPKKTYEEEKKSYTKLKDTLAFSFVGPDSKSVVCNTLLNTPSVYENSSFRIFQLQSKSRRYFIFDSKGRIQDQLLSVINSEYIVLILPITDIQQDYIKEVLIVLRNYINTKLVILFNFLETAWDNSAYNAAVQAIRSTLGKYGITDNTIIPISSSFNITTKVPKDIAPWYNGKTLLQTLDGLENPSKKPGKGARISLIPSADPNWDFIGKLLCGNLSLQSKLIIMPTSLRVELLSISDLNNNPIDIANPSDILKLRIKLPEDFKQEQGLILCEMQEICITSKEFRAEVNFFNLGEGLIESGFGCKLLIHSVVEDVDVIDVLSVIDWETKNKVKVKVVRNEQKAVVVIRASQLICAENASKGWECLGKFALVLGDRIIGVGKILELYNRVEEIASQMGL